MARSLNLNYKNVLFIFQMSFSIILNSYCLFSQFFMLWSISNALVNFRSRKVIALNNTKQSACKLFVQGKVRLS